MCVPSRSLTVKVQAALLLYFLSDFTLQSGNKMKKKITLNEYPSKTKCAYLVTFHWTSAVAHFSLAPTSIDRPLTAKTFKREPGQSNYMGSIERTHTQRETVRVLVGRNAVHSSLARSENEVCKDSCVKSHRNL